MKKAKRGNRFIKPSKKKICVVKKVMLKDDWAFLKEENGDHQILASRKSLRTWRKWKKIEEHNSQIGDSLIAIFHRL